MAEGKMMKSATDKWITGTAGGLAEKYGAPSIVLRLAFIFVPFGWLAYLILAFAVMESPEA